VWLVKIPSFLARAWETLGPDANLGILKVKEHKDNHQNTEMTIILGPEGYAKNLPKEYTISSLNNEVSLEMLEEDIESGGSVAFIGHVSSKLDVNPVECKEYREICQQRVRSSNVKDRLTETIQDSSTTFRPQILPKRTKLDEGRRERAEKNTVLDMLFQLFAHPPHSFDFRTLVEYTKQPTVYLKSILNEVCEYKVTGPLKGKYVLQDRYKGKEIFKQE